MAGFHTLKHLSTKTNHSEQYIEQWCLWAEHIKSNAVSISTCGISKGQQNTGGIFRLISHHLIQVTTDGSCDSRFSN